MTLKKAILVPRQTGEVEVSRSPGRWVRLIGIIFLSLLCWADQWKPLVSSNDFWMHAAAGRWIWEHHHVPTRTLFLWTVNQPWIAHSWLSEIFCFGLMRLGGETCGPTLALESVVVLGAITLGSLWRLCDPPRPMAMGTMGVFLLGYALMDGRFQTRPEIATILLYTLLLCWLTNRKVMPLARWEWISLPLTFALWANLHGGVLIGVIAVMIFAIGDLIQTRFHLSSRPLAALVPLCLVGMLLTPYGVRYFSIYASVHSKTFAMIEEWYPLIKNRMWSSGDWAIFVTFIALVTAAWVRTPNRRWGHYALFLTTLLMAWEASRNIVFAVLTGISILAPYLHQMRQDDSGRRPIRQFAGGVFCLAAFVNIALGLSPWPGMIVPAVRCLSLSRFIQSLHVPGRVFNEFNNASEMEWNLGERSPLFIDAFNAYPDRLFIDWVHLNNDTTDGPDRLTSMGVICVTGKRPAINDYHVPDLWRSLSSDPKWALVYTGGDGPVWVQRIPQYRRLWDGVPLFQGQSDQDFWNYVGQVDQILSRKGS